MKTKLATLLLFAAVAIASGQTFDVKTNYVATNWINAASTGATNVFTGATNDMRFYKGTVWYALVQNDDNDTTHTLDIVFANTWDATGSNWLSISNVASILPAGTNPVWMPIYEVTNYPYALMKPVAYTNNMTGNITNFSLWSSSKGYTKDK